MKGSNRFVFFLLFSVLVMGCRKDQMYFVSKADLEPLAFLPSPYLAKATKTVPGLGSIPWTANCQIWYLNNTFELLMETFNNTTDQFSREIIQISYVSTHVKKSKVHSYKHWHGPNGNVFGSYGRSLADGDVADGFWHINDTVESHIEITEINWKEGYVKGRFDLYFSMGAQSENGNKYSERINFNSGSFIAEIIE